MRLYIQDPLDPNAPFLHERILELCDGAIRGAGAFAFATRSGVDLLLNDAVFRRFAEHASFDLVVGVDEVTNQRALDALKKISEELPRLRVKVFYHNLQQTLFHPKFCWFRHRTKGFLVVGSGNLTAKGLRGNWEAFAVDELGARDFDALEGQWERWYEAHATRLRSVDDGDVCARAAQNILRRRPGRQGREPQPGEGAPPPLPPPAPETPVDHRVLIAEIPRASARWNQANFDLRSFREFFGAQPGTVRRVVLQHVDEDGVLQSLESRPSVAVKSRNFRFELEAAAGKPYPRSGRPIAVFVEIAPRTFRYRLLMPNDPQQEAVRALLDLRCSRVAGRMRRLITTTAETRQAWPDSPLWRMPLEVDE